MLPTLTPETTLDPLYRRFLDRLTDAGFDGDIEYSYGARLAVATDNSAFQQLPQGVLFPHDEDDIAQVFTLLAKDDFHGVQISPRGGGTSTIGCSLTQGLVLDCSRHMNRILECNLEAGWVRVQPGVVLDQLNAALVGDGVFFAPNVAPSSRATLGGMSNTDGCGKGSRIYGKTSDHVLETRLILADGTPWTASSCDRRSLNTTQSRKDIVGRIHREVDAVVHDNADEITQVFPKLSRYLSGYNLAQIYDAGDDRFNLNKLICGSEGTLAVVAELKLQLTPIPRAQTLFALRYDSFDDALRDAERLVAFDPSAIESLDDKVMGLARNNPIYARVRDYIENADGSTPSAVNLVEFSAIDPGALGQAVAPLQYSLDKDSDSRARGFYRADDPRAIAALWDLRKGGVGLLGSTPGDRKPLPFVEDTVVDPRYLADYVRDFRAVLDEYGLEYGMFGHIDVGCLHVRPALNLCDPDDERIMREVTDRVEKLARHYGGLLWNEHGKGFRSEYNPDYFGPTLYTALGRIKTAFDAHGQLNPGKIVASDTGALASMDAATRGAYDRQITAPDRQAFPKTIECNGNGACFNYNPFDVMCPSYRVTRDRLHSPKGRAGAMREWLRLLSQAGVTVSTQPQDRPRPLWRQAARDALRGNDSSNTDFSHEVWQAMDGCLSCRACATQCPVKVDVPAFKSRFLSVYHSRYRRPLSDYALALLEPAAPWLARMPGLMNRLIGSALGRAAMTRLVGISDPPRFSTPGIAAHLRRHPEQQYSPARFHDLDAEQQARTVFIVPDAFTTFFDAAVVVDVLRLIVQLGYRPMLLAFRANGKALQVRGFLPEFKRTAEKMTAYLREVAELGRPLVGIEPSVTLTYREEYPATLGHETVPNVLLLEEWLAGAIDDGVADQRLGDKSDGTATYTLFQHCTAETACPNSLADWQTTFARAGLTLDQTAVGCCGMSGAYGHETRHQLESRGIFDLSWQTAYASATATPLVPGYSCRSQLRRFGNAHPIHPAQALLAHLEA